MQYLEEMLARLRSLSDAERLELFVQFCTHCGSIDPSCVCWNDE